MLGKNKRVEHHIRMKIYKVIVLLFWVESDINSLCGKTQTSLVLYQPTKSHPLNT